jgi:4-hydroxythreonine-4-phosphate dehydrogenase
MTLIKNLTNLSIPFNIEDNFVRIYDNILKCIFTTNMHSSQTLLSLDTIFEVITKNDILLTLPSSKDQFKKDQIDYKGHTELFRKHFDNQNLAMCFLGNDSNFLLLTDHIDIKNISKEITLDTIQEKIFFFLSSNLKDRGINEIFFSGINPHCGENGLISIDDDIISSSIPLIKTKYPKINVHSMLAADTLHFNILNKNQLFIYAGHDQGLGVFKTKYGLTGINFTAGLPFRRVSVDHGTAFDLYGKNQANYISMIYLLKEILSWD